MRLFLRVIEFIGVFWVIFFLIYIYIVYMEKKVKLIKMEYFFILGWSGYVIVSIEKK